MMAFTDDLKILLSSLRELDRAWASGLAAARGDVVRDVLSAFTLVEAGLEAQRDVARQRVVGAARALLATRAGGVAPADAVDELVAALDALDAIP